MSNKMRKGDKVIAIAGNFRGQAGTVLSREGDKVVVQGLNIRKKHVKRSQQNPKGGVIEMEKPINISNLKICNEEGVPVKLRVKADKKGERELYYQDGKKEVVYRHVRKQKS